MCLHIKTLFLMPLFKKKGLNTTKRNKKHEMKKFLQNHKKKKTLLCYNVLNACKMY